MKLAHKIILASFLVILCSGSLQAKPWRGIVPLHSNRKEVERLLGKSIPSESTEFSYASASERVYFSFSNAATSRDCIKKLTLGTVMRIEVTPTSPTSLADLHLNPKQLITFDPSVPGGTGYQAYVDENEGMLVRTLSGKVDRIVYVAGSKERVICPTYYKDPSSFVLEILCILCPLIAVDSPDKAEDGTPITFAANIRIGAISSPLTYKWSLSAGTIIEGEGTPLIKVNTRDLGGKTIKATVEIGPVDPACPNTASSETRIVRP